MSRQLLLWQFNDFFRQLIWQRQWWATQEPETYGAWAEGQS